MTARLLSGTATSTQVLNEVKARVQQLQTYSIQPGLAVVIVGDDPASHIYVGKKVKACHSVGIYSEQHALPANLAETELLSLIMQLNRDPKIHGILVQLPLPKHISSEKIVAAIDPRKDVDGFHRENVGLLTQGQPRFVPCTPAGVMRLLKENAVTVDGAHAVVVGRSLIVGKPMALLLLQAHATVTIAHSRTRDLAAFTRQADILVAAVGSPNMITGAMVKPGAIVIDVGINRLPNGKLTGDVDFASVQEVAGLLTPVPGGVGPMTIAMLLANTVQAAGYGAAE